MKNAQVSVTGGAGFIGSHLVDRLIGLGNSVTVVDNLSYGNARNINTKATFFNVDIVNYGNLLSILKDNSFDFIYHLAAIATTRESSMGWENPLRDLKVNSLGTLNLLKACVELGINPRIIYISSAAIYGPPRYFPIDENHPQNPISPYGVHKLMSEKYLFAYSHEQSVDTVCVRLFNAYGLRQPRYVMYDLYRKLKVQPKFLKVLGTGEQQRTFCYISDIIDGILIVAEKGKGVYNLGHDRATSIKGLCQMMIELISPRTRICYTGKSWKGDINSLVPNISKIKRLGFSPKIELEDGLPKTFNWFQENEGDIG